jgi:hypothetical protein
MANRQLEGRPIPTSMGKSLTYPQQSTAVALDGGSMSEPIGKMLFPPQSPSTWGIRSSANAIANGRVQLRSTMARREREILERVVNTVTRREAKDLPPTARRDQTEGVLLRGDCL